MKAGDILAAVAVVVALGGVGFVLYSRRAEAQPAPGAAPQPPAAPPKPAPPPQVQRVVDDVKTGVDVLSQLWGLGSSIYTTLARK